MRVGLSASAVVAAPVADAGLVLRARLVPGALGTATVLEAEVGLALVAGGAVLAELGETLGGALVVDADAAGAALVLVAVRVGGLDSVALAVGAERAVDTLVRTGAGEAVLLRSVVDALLVNAAARRAARVLVAVGASLLDLLARATVAVRRGGALGVAVAERVLDTSADLRHTLASRARASGTVAVGLAARTGSGGGGASSRAGRRGNSGGGSVTSRVVVKGGGDVLEDLTVDKVTRNRLGHLESRKGSHGEDESRSDGGSHVEIEVATLARR